jgi:ADP-ribose pyrophosphatase
MSLVPWRKIGEPEIIAQGYGKTFIKQQFLDHKNQEADFFFVNTRDWATILAITQDNKVIMTRQYKQGADVFVDELPAGMAETSDKSPEQTAARELLEETGYEAAELVPLGFIWANSRNSHSRAHCFLATGCKKVTEMQLDESEELETYEIELNDFIAKILNTEIINWDAYIIILRALKHLGLKVSILRS